MAQWVKELATKARDLSLLLGLYMIGETDFCKLSCDLHMHAMTYTTQKIKCREMQIPGPVAKTVNQNQSGPQECVHKHRRPEKGAQV